MKPVDDNRLTEIIAHALWRNYHLRMRHKRLDNARLLATEVTRHLHICRCIVVRPEPGKLHSTPEPHESD